MKIILELEYWQAVRLSALVEDGYEILNQQGRSQRGIDAYTLHDLKAIGEIQNLIDKPKYVSKIELK